ncbi:hypothetical protein GCM10010080_19130 [Thermomonas carbonis]|nr:hypothetical protein GCM10010080_19130 [Thermomonas carbonis]
MQQIRDGSVQARPYETPQLKLYGSVQALTAGGTGPTNEGAGNPLICSSGMNTADQFSKHCQ